MKGLVSKICAICNMMKLGGILIIAMFWGACSRDEVPDRQENPLGSVSDSVSETVSPDYLPIDWDYTKIQSMDLNTGEFSLRFDGGKIPDFRDNVSLVVLQTDTWAYLRRVIHTQVDGSVATLQTIEATMEELFHDTEFTLVIGDDNVSRLVSSDNVITPARIVEVYEDNSYKVVYDKDQSRAEYIKIDPEIPISLFYIDRSGQSLNMEFGNISVTNLSLEAEQYVHSLTSTLLMHVGFGPAVNTKKITEKYKAKVSDIEDFNCRMSLDLLSRTRLKLSASHSFKKKGEVELQAPIYLFYTFMIGTVPVFFTENVKLKAAYEFGVEGNFSSTVGYEVDGNFTMGLEYEKGKKITSYTDHSFSSGFYPFEFKLDSPSLYSKLSIYPEITLKIYGTIGPKFAIVPYAESRLFSGYVIPQFNGWSNQFNLGLDMQLGGEITFLGLKGEIGVSKQIASKEVYRAPKFIRLSSPADGTEVELGKPVMVEFSVTGERTPLLSPVGKEEPVMMALVHFKSTGGTVVGKEYAMTDSNGKVRIEWIPMEKGASLSAVILDQDGTELDRATFTPVQDEEGNASIVGTWERVKTEVKMIYEGKLLYTLSSSPSDYGYRDFWVLREDGTIDGYDTDAVGWPYGTYTFADGILNVHYLNDSGSDENTAVIKLTNSELVVRNVAEDTETHWTWKIATTYYIRITDQDLIDRIDQATKRNPAKWWK